MHTHNVSYFFLLFMVLLKERHPPRSLVSVYTYSLTLLNAVFSGQKLCLNRHGFKPPFVWLTRLFLCLFVFCRFKIHEDTDTSLDDLSDCSSDSMEVCCDDLGESF